MKTAAIKFAGFTEGCHPFGRQPVFTVRLECGTSLNLLPAQVTEIGLTIPDKEAVKLQDAQHTWNNSGLCDDHLTRLNPHSVN
jgi:hypothetical protein